MSALAGSEGRIRDGLIALALLATAAFLPRVVRRFRRGGAGPEAHCQGDIAMAKVSWLPSAATALAVLFCYGTSLLIGLLAILGISIAVDERAWTGAIVFSAAVAAACIALSGWKRRFPWPTAAAALGLGSILWAMYGTYSRTVELAGFGLLAAAAIWDLRSRSSPRAADAGTAWIAAADLARRLAAEPRPVIVDVRGADEFAGELGHIEGAFNLPVAELSQRIGELEAFKADELVLVCKTQMRSAKASAMLTEAGFAHVAVLHGGMVEWTKQGPSADSTGTGGAIR